ncbi:Oxidoreductase, molybdopterin-binding domain-containing protein [Coniochaeta sp. 2T2.1]|nr:Oxidoreductase, molybdopterin-binding domain-containing protein [Coniochaeta sp. 2T2.1]
MATIRASVRLSLETLRCATRCQKPSSTLRSCHNPLSTPEASSRRAFHSSPIARSIPPKSPPPKPRTARVAAPLTAAGAGLLGLFTFSQWRTTDRSPSPHSEQAAPKPTSAADTDDRDPSVPRFRLSDIRQHDASSPEPWVTYQDKVYDITDWVAAHPGGDVILRAAGGAIDAYWDIFTIHKAAHVYEILAQYHIGYIDAADLVDGRPAAEAIEDPFEQDPVRDERLITHTAKPRNAEPPNYELDREFKTPNELFYVRNHMWVPVVKEEEAEGHVLSVELPDGEVKEYTLADLKTRFKTHRVTAVLQCSGNRRNDMTRHAGKTNGLQWGVGAISNAEWEGVRLADVLADAGLRVVDPASLTADSPTQDGESETDSNKVNPNLHHVQFSGLEAYGASIPLSTALDPRGDVLLAFAMNGAPLPRDHGYPLRSVIPGHVAARSVKWLSKIVVADEESPSQWQRRDYKGFGPNEGADPDWERARAIQEMPVTSAITRVWVGDGVRGGSVSWLKDDDATKLKDKVTWGGGTGKQEGKGVVDIAAVGKDVGFTSKSRKSSTSTLPSIPTCDTHTSTAPVALQGYAYSGGGREISRVDISLDGGKTWDQASLVDDWESQHSKGSKHWAWKRWRYVGQLPRLPIPSSADELDVRRHCTELVVKATDDAYNTQPGDHGGIYNVRGNLATAWHRVKVCPRCVGGGGKKDGKGKGGGVSWSTAETYGCGFKKDAEEVREHMLASDAK